MLFLRSVSIPVNEARANAIFLMYMLRAFAVCAEAGSLNKLCDDTLGTS